MPIYTEQHKNVKNVPDLPVTASGERMIKSPLPLYRAEEMTQMEDRGLTVDKTGTHPCVRSGAVYRWIGKRSMPAPRVGRLWKFKKDEMDAWVKADETDVERYLESMREALLVEIRKGKRIQI